MWSWRRTEDKGEGGGGGQHDTTRGRLVREYVDVEVDPNCVITHGPELDEILQHGGCDEQAVKQRVGQEEDEELVVGEAHAVVHPGEREKGQGQRSDWVDLEASTQ